MGQGIFGNVEVDQQPYRIEAIVIQHCQLGQAPVLKKGTTESKYKFLRYLPIISHLKICAPLWIFRHYSFIHSKIESIWKCFWNVHCALPAFLTTFIIWNIIRIFKYNLKAHQGMDMLWLPLFSAFGNNILTYLSIKPIQKCCF